MANIAQMVNVLQSMILTRDDEMVLTPTYHVFRMYVPHQGAEVLPLYFKTESVRDRYNEPVDLLTTTASRAADGTITLSMANVDLERPCRVTVALDDDRRYDVSGELLTAENINDHNTFENPDCVHPVDFDGFEAARGSITVTVPAKSIVSLTLK